MKKIISLMMVMVMLLFFGSGAFAHNLTLDKYSDFDDVELLKEVISNMSPKEKSIFLEMIQSSTEEQEFYKENIDRNYNVITQSRNSDIYKYNTSFSHSNIRTQSIAADLSYFNAQIAGLGLSRTAVMLFKAVAASLATAVADGPLPVGEIMTVITGTLTVVYLAANWDEIGPKWDRIVRIYTTTFSMIRTSISRVFSDLKSQVLDRVSSSPSVSVSGTTITVNGTRYRCDERAEEAVSNMQRRNHYYYPAVIYRNEVLVAPVEIDRNTALEIMKFNSRTAGVFAISDSRARGLCSGLGRVEGPEGDSRSGYWKHYHASNYRNAHCWFIH